jgi:hypothetical protein
MSFVEKARENYQVIKRMTREMRWYLAGPMTGLPQYNFPEFNRVARMLRECGVKVVVNPAELNTDPDTKEAVTDSYQACLKRSIQGMLTCDGLVLLDGWQNSHGALVERKLAEEVGMTIMTVNELVGLLS